MEQHCFALPTAQTPTRDREQPTREQQIAISHVVIAAQQSNPSPLLRLREQAYICQQALRAWPDAVLPPTPRPALAAELMDKAVHSPYLLQRKVRQQCQPRGAQASPR